MKKRQSLQCSIQYNGKHLIKYKYAYFRIPKKIGEIVEFKHEVLGPLRNNSLFEEQGDTYFGQF